MALTFTPAVAVAAATSGVFLSAASGKVVNRGALRRTLRELGLEDRRAAAAARVVPVFEVAVGVAITGLAPAALGAGLVTLAALGIGSAGIVAMAKGARIPCACFSASSSAVLGPRQVVVAVALLAAAGYVASHAPAIGVRRSLLLLAVVSLACAVRHLVAARQDMTTAVRYRRLTSGAYPA